MTERARLAVVLLAVLAAASAFALVLGVVVGLSGPTDAPATGEIAVGSGADVTLEGASPVAVTHSISSTVGDGATGRQVGQIHESEVNVTSSNAPVLQGENLTVSATVNAPALRDDEAVTLTVNGTVRDEATVDDTGEHDVTFTWNETDEHRGEFVANVSYGNAEDSTNVTVQKPAFVAVEEVVANESVVEGEELVVEANVTNLGDVTANRTITLAVDDTVLDARNVSLDGEESETFELAGDAPASDGTYTATVASGDDDANATVSVLATGTLTTNVSLDHVAPDEAVNVTVAADGENGAANATKLDAERRTATVALGGLVVGEDYTVVAEAEPYTANQTTVTVGQNGTRVGLELARRTGSIGGAVTDAESEQRVENATVELYRFGQGELTASNVTDANGTYGFGGVPVGNHRIAVSADGFEPANASVEVNASETATANVTIERRATANVTIESVTRRNATLGVDENATVNATLANNGSANGSATVNLSVAASNGTDDRGATAETVTVPANDSVTVSFPLNASELGVGEFNVTVEVGNSSASDVLAIRNPTFFDVDIVDADREVVAGEPLNVTANVTNRGDVPDEQTIRLLDGENETLDAANVSLNGSETATVDLRITNASRQIGPWNLTVASEDDAAEHEVTVLAPAEFVVPDVAANETISAGDSLAVDALVRNDGDVSSTENVTLTVTAPDGPVVRNVTNTNVTVSSNESRTISFEVNTSGLSPGNYTAAVGTDDDAANATVRVLAERTLTVSVSLDHVAPDETVNATVTVHDAIENATERVATLNATRPNATVAVDDLEASVNYTVTANATRYVANQTTVTLGENGSAVELARHTGEVAGTVTDAENGSVANATLDLHYFDADEPARTLPGTTDANGSFAVDDVPVGNHTLVVRADGYENQTVNVSVAANETAAANATLHERADDGDGGDGGDSGGIGLPAGSGGSSPDPAPDPEPVLVLERVEPTDATVEVGETVAVEAVVTNDGDAAGTTTVEIVVDERTVLRETVSVAAGESETVAYEVDTGELEPDVYRTEVQAAGEDVVGALYVTETLPDENESDDDGAPAPRGDGDDGSPGFGIVAALVALGALAVVRARRRA